MKIKIVAAPRGAKKAANGISLPGGDSNALEPLTGDMQVFRGKSHKKGGIPYAGIEVEGGEPLYKAANGESVIFGNMTSPLTGNKFKKDALLLAKKEQKVDAILSKADMLLKTANPEDKWEELAFNSGKAMQSGGTRKKAELKVSKEHLASLQQAMLDTAEEMGADPGELSKGKIVKAKNGITLKAENGLSGDDPKPWDFKGTNKEKLDAKIKEFVALVEKKGLTGYSSADGGYSKRNTLSGRKSRHASNQALDMIFSDKDAYNKILQDPELSGFLINNGLTAINEYDPKVQKKTGADVGHLHIGYDQGTPLSEAFRQDAKKLYGNQPWKWDTRVKGSSAPIKGAPAGDIQGLKPADPLVLNPFTPGKERTTPLRTVQGSVPEDYTFNTPVDKPIRSNARGLNMTQILPEIYAGATNQQEAVHLQQYDPQLFQPYNVSFQDRLNENRASFSSLERIMKDNPSAISTLAGQKYAADNSVMGDEFRTNQQIEADVTNKNIALLNDAQLKNLSLADQQYTRQAQAKSNTKLVDQGILSSISSKVMQNEARNQSLKYYESMTGYRWNPDSSKMEWMGRNNSDMINTGGTTPLAPINTKVEEKKDALGNVVSTKSTTPGNLDTLMKNNDYFNKNYQNILPFSKKTKSFSPLMKENGGTIQQLSKKR